MWWIDASGEQGHFVISGVEFCSFPRSAKGTGESLIRAMISYDVLWEEEA